MKLQDYINIAIYGFQYNLPMISIFLLICGILVVDTNALGKYYLIFDITRILVVLIVSGFVLLQIVAMKHNAMTQNTYSDWVLTLGFKQYFLDDTLRVHEKNIQMLIYFVIVTKCIDIYNIIARQYKNELIHIGIISALCSLQIYGLLNMVSLHEFAYPIIGSALVILHIILVCDRLIHYLHHSLNIIPMNIYDTTKEVMQKTSGVFYTIHEQQKGYSIQIQIESFIVLNVFGILLIFIKDLFFNDIDI